MVEFDLTGNRKVEMAVVRDLYRYIGGHRFRFMPAELRQRIRGNSVVNSAGNRLYIDPADRRGRRLFEGGGVVDRDAVRLWDTIVRTYSPTVVLDVGANYGEVALSCTYSPRTEVHLVEANPRIARTLEKSISSVPNATLHPFAASSSPGTVRLFRTGVLSSGRSSIVPFAQAESTVVVPAARLDDTIVVPASARMCFKVDVEGAEVAALAGMAGLLHEGDWVGMVEYLNLGQEDLDWLRANFTVRAIDSTSLALRPFPRSPLSIAQRRELGLGKDAVLFPISSGLERVWPS
jgi:FkbM family methyltransferase